MVVENTSRKWDGLKKGLHLLSKKTNALNRPNLLQAGAECSELPSTISNMIRMHLESGWKVRAKLIPTRRNYLMFSPLLYGKGRCQNIFFQVTHNDNSWPAKLFVADAPMKKNLEIQFYRTLFCCGCPYEKKSRNIVLPPSQSTLKYGSENRPWLRGLNGAFQVDMGEENENDVGQEEVEEEIFTVENPSIDLEVTLFYLRMDQISGIGSPFYHISGIWPDIKLNK